MNPHGSIRYRPITRQDVPLMTALTNRIYDIKKRDDFFIWQCFENVFPVVVYGGFAPEGRLAGIFGVQKRLLSNGLSCGQASWMNVDPAFRRQGHFAGLGRLALNHFRDLDMLCVFANAEGRTACERAFGFVTAGTIKAMTLAATDRISAEGIKVENVTSGTRFPSYGSADANRLAFEHTSQYRVWRYASSVVYSYMKVSLPEGQYALCKLFTDPVSGAVSGDIVDFECGNPDAGRLKTLFGGAALALFDRGASKVTTWALPGSTALRQALAEAGFAGTGHETYFGIKTLRPGLDYVFDFGSWDLIQADATNY